MTDSYTEKWRQRVDSRLDTIEVRLTDIEKNVAVEEVHRKNVETRLTKIENNLKWVAYLVIGAIVANGLDILLSTGG